MSLKDSLKYVRERRKKDILSAQRLYDDILEKYPYFYALEKEIRSLRLNVIKGVEKESKLEPLYKKRDDFLSELKVSYDMLNPTPHCSICQDTGVTSNGYCRCVIMQETALTLSLPTFSDSNFELFCGESELAKKVYSLMEKYCQKFPNVNKCNVVIVGKCGSGKTFLASAMADAVSKKGYSSFFTTAFGFINDMLKYHVSPIDQKADIISSYLECDMLVLDDLGSEAKLNNVSEEYLYLILSERMAKKRCTVVTSNLDYEQITARYGQRISSRLFDKNNSIITSVSNIDLRKN